MVNSHRRTARGVATVLLAATGVPTAHAGGTAPTETPAAQRPPPLELAIEEAQAASSAGPNLPISVVVLNAAGEVKVVLANVPT